MNKYISQQNNLNFVYPNYNLAEYDVDIIHNINVNGVTGTLNSSSFSGTSSNVTLTLNATWTKNDAEVYINSENILSLWSVHCMTPNKQYYKPWRMVSSVGTSSTGTTTYTATESYTITPEMMAISLFTTGTYYFEIRFIGGTSVYPISFTKSITI